MRYIRPYPAIRSDPVAVDVNLKPNPVRKVFGDSANLFAVPA